MYDNLDNPQKKMEIAEHYRSVLLKRKDGRKMFTHMLGELGLMESTQGKSERELGRFDYAIHLLSLMGITSYPNIHQFVNASVKWPIEYPEPEMADEDGEMPGGEESVQKMI